MRRNLSRALRRAPAAAALVVATCLALSGTVFSTPARGSGYRFVSPGAAGKVAGAALPNVAPDSLSDVAAAVDRLRADGMNTISLDVWWMTDSPSADVLHPYSASVSDTELADEIALARGAGLQVDLTPLFYCAGCDGGFRGAIHPSNPTAFFASYRAFVEHYAGLAQAASVDTYLVGSEMSSLERYTALWRGLIGQVRRTFRGRISYEENWDALGRARFLGALDVIGVSAYFPLDASATPSLGQLLADWHSAATPGWKGRDWVSAVAAVAANYHRPILFGEVGYMSGDYAGAQPYLNYYSLPNQALQADLYQALLETFEPYPWWAGVIWWDWDIVPDALAANGRTFQGKGAEVMLTCWYAEGMRPDDPATALP